MLEEVWLESWEEAREGGRQGGREGDRGDLLKLPSELLSNVVSYCKCKDEEENSDFCRAAFVSFYSAPRKGLKGTKSVSGFKRKKLIQETSIVSLHQGDGERLSSFVRAVASQLLVHNVVVVIDMKELPSMGVLSSLARDSLASPPFLTVQLVEPGTNLTSVLLAGNMAATVVVALGRAARTVVTQVTV